MTPRGKALAAGVAAWVFGLASTVLLVALWGRAVVTDTEELAQSLDPMAQSTLVADRLSGWLVDQLTELGVDPTLAGDAGGMAIADPSLAPIFEELVAWVVEAMADDDPAGATVDVAALVLPRVDDITLALSGAGLPVSRAQVEAAVVALDPIMVRGRGRPPLIGGSSPLAGHLGTASLAGAVTMLLSGWSYVRLSSDRNRATRSLFQRFGLGALSFAVFLRIGSWITDPRGGRAPVGETLSRLIESKAVVPFLLGTGALAAAGGSWLVRRKWAEPGAGDSTVVEPVGSGVTTA